MRKPFSSLTMSDFSTPKYVNDPQCEVDPPCEYSEPDSDMCGECGRECGVMVKAEEE